MNIVKLTDQEKNNLLAFLMRCTLQGQEAPAFLALVNKIQLAQPETDKAEPAEAEMERPAK